MIETCHLKNAVIFIQTIVCKNYIHWRHHQKLKDCGYKKEPVQTVIFSNRFHKTFLVCHFCLATVFTRLQSFKKILKVDFAIKTLEFWTQVRLKLAIYHKLLLSRVFNLSHFCLLVTSHHAKKFQKYL